MSRIALAALIAAGVVVGVIVVVSYGDDGESASTTTLPAALPSEPGEPDMTFDEDPFDFNTDDLDPAYVWEDAEIDLTCGQLLGEAQLSRYFGEPIERAERHRGEKYPDGYIVGCKFWSNTIDINFLQIDYWNGSDTVVGCEEDGPAILDLEADPAGPADSYAKVSGDGFAMYRVCFSTAKLELTGTVYSDGSYPYPTQAGLRTLAQFYAANLGMFDQAARTF